MASPPPLQPRRAASSSLPFVAGALAGAAEVAVSYPLEAIKTLMQVQPKAYPTMAQCARSVIARLGVAGLYRGVAPHLLFAFPRVGIRFAAYDAAAAALQGGAAAEPRRALTPPEALAAGLVAGAAEAFLVTVPMTTLAVRLVADSALPAPRFASFPAAVALIVREEGLGGLYRGAAPTGLKVAFQIAARFALFGELSAALARAAPRGPLRWLSPGAYLSCCTLAAGALAGGITVCLNQPIDVIKSRMQAAPRGTYAGMAHCARAVVAEAGGYGGLYAGFTPRLCRVVAETSLCFLFYEQIFSYLRSLEDSE
jgi:hypothetical protein